MSRKNNLFEQTKHCRISSALVSNDLVSNDSFVMFLFVLDSTYIEHGFIFNSEKYIIDIAVSFSINNSNYQWAGS